ncbi:MAG TPA: 3-oxoacyl-ACP reductase FabG [Flavobacteriales bacterium]|nr:3-oxoacyl-ACP reductase FabG [Flavobacteriales bacterium]
MNIALVTGASGGIGEAICLQLSTDHSLHVLVHYFKNEGAANDLVKKIKDHGGSSEIIQFDVSVKTEVENALKNWWANNHDAAIDVLVNNAGITRDSLMTFMQESDWDDTMNIKLKGFYNVTHSVLQKMLLKRSGRIINIGSIAGLYGQPGQVNYSAANGGLIAATKSLAREIGKRNITVNAISPGYIETSMTKEIDADEMNKHIPAGRFGTPKEVAHLVSFLASEKAAYINGEVIKVSGGL